jgi:carboxylesterase type B
VTTSLGKIRGHFKTSHDGRKFSAFEGVPFARPPIGSRRFEVGLSENVESNLIGCL